MNKLLLLSCRISFILSTLFLKKKTLFLQDSGNVVFVKYVHIGCGIILVFVSYC